MKKENVITAERVGILYKRSFASISTAIVVAFIFVYILREQIASIALLIWIGYMIIVTLFRYWFLFDYNKTKQNTSHHDKFENRFIYAAGLIGLGWAFIIVSGLNLPIFEYRLYSLLLLVAIVAISVPIFSSSIKTIYFYITPSLITSILFLLSRGGDDTAIGFALIVFTAMVIRTSKDTYNMLNDTLILRFQTQEQAENLKQLQHEKSVSEQRMQGILDYIPAAIYVKDLDGQFTFLNRKVANLHKMPRKEIIGKTLHDILPKNIADEIRQNDIDVINIGKPIETEESAPGDNGLRHYISIKFPIFDKSGKISEIGGVSTDITDRFNAEESLRISQQRLLLHREQSPLGVIEWNTDFEFLDWNPAAEKIFGFTKEEVHGQHITKRILPESSRAAVDNVWEELIANKGGFYSLNDNITKDGRTILCEWHNTPLVDDDGNVIGVTSLVDDVTERKRIEMALVESRNDAEEANQAKSQFLSSMSHELRTPLNAILGFSQLIEMNAKDDITKRNSQEIIDGGNHLLQLINQVLDLSKIESGMVDLSIKSHSFNKIFKDTLSFIQPIADKHAIRICNKVSPSSDINIDVDETRFKQVLLNVLSNAIKYNSENGNVTINCSTNDEKMLCLSITDSGNGLTAEQQTNIFLPFDRAGAENSNIEGTGLGLAISKNLIEQMGGKITVESEVGKGSCFLVQVPLS